MKADYTNCTLMLVDDEPAILKSLQRLLRRLGCQIVAFDSPDEALAHLQAHEVNLIISDMRMPQMNGEAFFQQVVSINPDIERIALSGYADAQATIDAVNKGKITRFLQKPWEDEEVLKVVEKGFQLAQLKRENERLQEEMQAKNEALQNLNNALESRVEERTQQLHQAHESLQQSYRQIVRMFSALTARRLGVKASSENQRLNKLMLGVAAKMGIDEGERRQLFYAWQLRHIGKLSLNDELIRVPYLEMSPEEQRVFQQHPVLANAACLLVKPLYPAGQIIVQHKEYLDGSGYPRGLQADQIQQRAQILCVVNDYIELIQGMYAERDYSTAEALHYLSHTAKERYNQAVVKALAEIIELLSKTGDSFQDNAISTEQLHKGMKLSRDLISSDGLLLLSAHQVLDDTAIERIREMEFNLKEAFEVYVTQ